MAVWGGNPGRLWTREGMTTIVHEGSTDSMMYSDLKYRWECGPDQPQKDLPWTLLYLLGFKQRKEHGQDFRTCS